MSRGSHTSRTQFFLAWELVRLSGPALSHLQPWRKSWPIPCRMHSLCKQPKSTLHPSTQLVACSFPSPICTIGSASVMASSFYLFTYLFWVGRVTPFPTPYSLLSALMNSLVSFLISWSVVQNLREVCRHVRATKRRRKETLRSGEAIRAGVFEMTWCQVSLWSSQRPQDHLVQDFSNLVHSRITLISSINNEDF